jgi:outer membrane protein assembly factor BamA
MKYLLIFMLIASVGCGSRKVEKEKVVSEVTEFKQFASLDTTEIKTNTVWNADSYSIEPIDNSIPMLVDGKSYSNVRIKREKASAVTNVVEKKRVSEKASIEVKEKVSSELKVSDKKGLDIFTKISIIVIAIGIIVLGGKFALK